MLSLVFWAGTLIGAVAGLAHAVQIVTTQSGLPGRNAGSAAVYRAVWAVALWTIAGGYLLMMWLVGLVLRPLIRPFLRSSCVN